MDQPDVDQLVDHFVERINRAARQRIREEDLPVHLRQGGARYGLYYSWRIQPFAHVTWIEPLEEKIGIQFPPSYRSLVTRYVFPAFQAPPLLLLGNTGHALYSEMAYALFRDRALSGELLNHGFVQIARPSEGDYDPICLDMRGEPLHGEYPLVRLNHAAVLQGFISADIRDVAPTFRDYIVDFLQTPDLAPVAETLPSPVVEVPRRKEVN